jgi:hypothetical protein
MFPFDYPLPTIAYLALYGVTLVVHVLTMNYVLAGSTFLAVLGVWQVVRGPSPRWRPVAELVRDWLPFALGVTITAGVAPLLFVQVLYKLPFYTANLLLFTRWMAILPVLIAAFYLLYLQKSHMWDEFRPTIRAAISVGILACFAFTAWSWTENHLLSLRGQATWVAEYAADKHFYRDPELVPRLSVWYLGAFSVWATAVAWQLWYKEDATPRLPQTVAIVAAVTLLAGLAAAIVYLLQLPEDLRTAMLHRRGWAYAAAATTGGILQLAAWHLTFYRGQFARRPLMLASLGVVLAVAGAAGLREIRRAAAIDLHQLAEAHASAARVDGLYLFLLFLVANTAVLAGVVMAVRRGLRRAAAQADDGGE